MPTLTSPQPAISPKYFDFLNKESMIDVTVVADGHMMHAHKIVLAACSTYFEEIFAIIPDKHPAIVLSDVPHTFLTLMMEFIYCGKVDIEEKDVARFQKVLKNLRIESTRPEPTHFDHHQLPPKRFEIPQMPMSQSHPNESQISYFDPEIKIKEEKIDEMDIGTERVSDWDRDYEFEDDDSKSENGEHSGDFRSILNAQRVAMIRQNLSKTLSPRPEVPFYLQIPRQRVRVDSVIKRNEDRIFMDEHPELCPFCKKRAKTSKHRNEHVKYCTENPDRVVSKCPYCEKSFCDPYYVRKHIRTIHSEMANVKNEESFHMNMSGM